MQWQNKKWFAILRFSNVIHRFHSGERISEQKYPHGYLEDSSCLKLSFHGNHQTHFASQSSLAALLTLIPLSINRAVSKSRSKQNALNHWIILNVRNLFSSPTCVVEINA